MKKILIYMDKDELKPVGGPKGYLWNLLPEIQNFNSHDNDMTIEFLEQNKSKNKTFLKKILLPIYERVTNRTPYIRAAYRVASNKNKETSINLNKYDAIHFHTTYSMYMIKDSLEKYKGKVILTSHSPKALHKEYLDDYITQKEKEKFSYVLNKLENMDDYAFNKADAIIFPCSEAKEPYFHTWTKFNTIYEKNKDKFYYVPTGIRGKTVKEDSASIRNKYGIPKDAFVVSFVGRHNEVKGYEFLKKIANKIIQDYDNVYFLIAGKEEPLKRLEHKQWIECGWTNDTASIIASSDLFVLPNKETYFDLIMLEVLSIGTPIMCTNTGGNKYFRQFDSSGIKYVEYGDVENAYQLLEKFFNYDKETLNLMKCENRKLFEKNFTTQKFFNKYIKVINDILAKD